MNNDGLTKDLREKLIAILCTIMKHFFNSFLITAAIYASIICNNSEKYQLDQIHNFADVLNIEGGTIAKKLTSKQKWFNVATILDRPYIDGVEFDFMAKNKKYDLKESAIKEYNELQNFFVHTSLIKYCIDNAHRISTKKNGESVKIIVQVHRPKSGIKYINILYDIIKKAYPEFCNFKKIEGKLANELFMIELPKKVSVHFRFGSEPHTLIDFDDADIIISISLVAGFNANFKPGDIVIPTDFVPMDLDTMVLKSATKYSVQNSFARYLEEIINGQDEQLMRVINNNFKSPNNEKHALKAKKFIAKDFNQVKVLHVNKNFSPSLLPKEFQIQ